MKKRLLPGARAAFILAVHLALTSPAPATTQVTGTLINVDFDGTGGAGGSTNPVTFDGDLAQNEVTAASVALEDAEAGANDLWNGFLDRNLTEQPLLDSAGAETAVKLSWSGLDGNYTNYLNGRTAPDCSSAPTARTATATCCSTRVPRAWAPSPLADWTPA